MRDRRGRGENGGWPTNVVWHSLPHLVVSRAVKRRGIFLPATWHARAAIIFCLAYYNVYERQEGRRRARARRARHCRVHFGEVKSRRPWLWYINGAA